MWSYPTNRDREANWDGTISAVRFLGDGSLLTGISAASTTMFPLAVASGGTAGITSAEARMNLSVAVSSSIINLVYPLAIASGGTASSTAADARVELGVAASNANQTIAYPLAAASGGTGTTAPLQVVYPLAIASGGTANTAFISGGISYYDSGAAQLATSAGLVFGRSTLYLSGALATLGIGTAAPVISSAPGIHVYAAGTAAGNYHEGNIHIGGSTSGLGGQLSYHALGSGRVTLTGLNTAGETNTMLSLGFGYDTTTGRPTTEVLRMNGLYETIAFGLISGASFISRTISGALLSIKGAISGATLYSSGTASAARLYVGGSSTQSTITKIITGAANLDFGTIPAAQSITRVIIASGSVNGDPVFIGWDDNVLRGGSNTSNTFFTAWVSGANAVAVRGTNNNPATSAATVAGDFKCIVFQTT